jgi:RNA polymerase sigma factor (sigma-70 family)
VKHRSDVEKMRWQRKLGQGRYDTGLIEFVNEVAAAACATRALSGLCPSGDWNDDALAEAVQGLWAGKLTEALPKALQTPSVGAMSRYIEATLRNWLIDEARKRGTPRIRSRVREALKKEPFHCHQRGSDPADELWGLSGEDWQGRPPFTGAASSLVTHLYDLDLVTIPPNRGDGRADSVISTEELNRALVGLFEGAGCCLTLDQLTQGLTQRFHSYFPPLMVQAEDEYEEVSDERAETDDLVCSAEQARVILAQMTSRQYAVMRARFVDNMTLEEIAGAFDCSRGTADNEIKRASAVMGSHLEPGTAFAVWKSMLDLSSTGIDPLSEGDPL